MLSKRSMSRIFQEKPIIMFEKPRKSVFWEYVEAILWAGGVALITITFIVQAFKIPSGSMLTTLQIGDYLLVNKFLYGLKKPFSDDYLIEGTDPQVGDIIVFRYPKDPSLDYIKRIVGVPGDTLEMRNRQLLRNGENVGEPYVQHVQPPLYERDNFPALTVPPGKYFVLGDNRDESADSRIWGFVDRNAIRGKAWRIYWSWEGFDNIRWERMGKAIE